MAIIIIGCGLGWLSILKEHSEAISLPLDRVDFRELKDGTFIGKYSGGMYKWRENAIKVVVISGKVTDIKILMDKEKMSSDLTNALFESVIEEQSLQVDAISGATLTSKAYFQGVENALKQAQK